MLRATVQLVPRCLTNVIFVNVNDCVGSLAELLFNSYIIYVCMCTVLCKSLSALDVLFYQCYNDHI